MEADGGHKQNHQCQLFQLLRRIVILLGLILLMLSLLYRSTYPFHVFPRWSSSSLLINFTSSSTATPGDGFSILGISAAAPLLQSPVSTDVSHATTPSLLTESPPPISTAVTARTISSDFGLPLSPAEKKGEPYKLNSILKKAARRDKTVILTTLNEAWAAPGSVFDIFLESFKIGNETKRLLKHLVVIALDQKAYKRCLGLHPHCYFLRTNGEDFSGSAAFMSTEYLDMMWRRILFLQTVLELGYNFVFTDTDIMWFRDPFPRFYSDADFQIACDDFRGNPSDMANIPNGGFSYVKSNNRTIKFYEFWYSSRLTYPQLHDQDVLNAIKLDPLVGEIGVKIKFFDTKYFGGFCQPSKDLNEVCTMHANCCIGLHKKNHDLRVMLADWRKFLALPDNLKASQPTSWTVPQKCAQP